MLTVTVKHTFPREDLEDILVTAFDGAYGAVYYWCSIRGRKDKDGGATRQASWDVILDGGTVTLNVEGELKDLDMKKLEAGLQQMATDEPEHFQNLVDETYDAETADVLIQFVLFGKIVYG